MKILLAGLRGVGKSTVGQLVAKETGFPLHGLSDFLRKEFPDFSGSSSALRAMIETLPIQERTKAYQRVIRTLNAHKHFILEMPIVERGAFGLMLPREPILRFVLFDAFILLEAKPTTILKQRQARPPRGQDPFYLEEPPESIEVHQETARQMLIGLGVTLAKPIFIIRNDNDPATTAQAIIKAIAITDDEAAFYMHLSAKS